MASGSWQTVLVEDDFRITLRVKSSGESGVHPITSSIVFNGFLNAHPRWVEPENELWQGCIIGVGAEFRVGTTVLYVCHPVAMQLAAPHQIKFVLVISVVPDFPALLIYSVAYSLGKSRRSQ